MTLNDSINATTTMEKLVNKTDNILCTIDKRAREILAEDTEHKQQNKKFITILGRAIESCIKWDSNQIGA